MTKTTPYLLVKHGKSAIKLYEEVFGAKLLETQAFTPEMGKPMGFPTDFDYESSTMHAILDFGGTEIFLTDGSFGNPAEGRVEIVLYLDTKQQADDIWKHVKSKKFKILMPFAKRFGDIWHGRFIDSEGVGWQLHFQEAA